MVNKRLMVFLLSHRQTPYVKRGLLLCSLFTKRKRSGKYNLDFIYARGTILKPQSALSLYLIIPLRYALKALSKRIWSSSPTKKPLTRANAYEPDMALRRTKKVRLTGIYRTLIWI